ncbi:MAG: SMC-Scp complex subunit ScpB [bacterium]
MEKDNLISVLESLLFVTGEPIKKAKLLGILGIEMEQLDEALQALMEKYKNAQSGITLFSKGEEIQLVSSPENGEFVEILLKNEMQDALSPAAMEVASIIAYRGPISKTEIEAIRGVNCAYTLRSLLLRGLIERNDNPGDSRGYVYAISFDFLKKLGVENVNNLPEYDILSKDERINSIISKE